MNQKRIAVLIGSLRKESYNRKMANNLLRLAPVNLKLEILEISQLPMYNQDLDEKDPLLEWIDFRKQVKSFDGIIFVTPEYNRSVPAVLKNAIDVGSRPYGQNSWEGKAGAVISVSTGVIGGFGANHHLRQSLVFLNVLTMQQPEAYIGGAAKLFDEKGEFAKSETKEFVQKFLNEFSTWAGKITC